MALLFFVFLGLLFWMFFVEPKLFRIKRPTLHIPKKLPKPLKVMHLSDIHFAYPNTSMNDFFDRLSREEVDFIFITGDIIDCREGVRVCTETLKKLKPKYGIYAVLGNHDYYDYDLSDCFFRNFKGQRHPLRRNATLRLREELKKIGVTVLRNETVCLNVEDTQVCLHGVDDAVTGHADLTKIVLERGHDKVNLLLTHTIDVIYGLTNKRMDLSFSGHTHGGQICLPFWGAIVTHSDAGRKYAAGIKPYMGIQSCVSKGMGASRFIPVRLFCRPEAIILTLKGHE